MLAFRRRRDDDSIKSLFRILDGRKFRLFNISEITRWIVGAP